MMSHALLRTSLTLLTSQRRHRMTLVDLADDMSVTPVTVAHSRSERLLRRSRRQPLRKLWRRINGRTTAGSRPRSKQRGRSSLSWSTSRVGTLGVGVSKVLEDSDVDFVLMVESTEAAYVASRHPGCSVGVIDQHLPVSEYRFITSTHSTRHRRLLRRVDAALSSLLRASVIKRFYYKWWTSTDCLSHVSDPDIWTPSSVDRNTAVDETSDDERIFLRSPVLAERVTSRQQQTTREPNKDDTLQRNRSSLSPDRNPVNVTATARSTNAIANKNDSLKHRHSNAVWSSTSTAGTTKPTTSSVNTTTTTTTTTTPATTKTTTKPPLSLPNRKTYRVRNCGRHLQGDADEDRLSVEDDEDQFDWVFVTRCAPAGHHQIEDDPDSFTLADDYNISASSRSFGLVSEQEMVVKEHLRSGRAKMVDASKQTTGTTTTGRRTVEVSRSTTVTSGCSHKARTPSAVMMVLLVLLLPVVSLTLSYDHVSTQAVLHIHD